MNYCYTNTSGSSLKNGILYASPKELGVEKGVATQIFHTKKKKKNNSNTATWLGEKWEVNNWKSNTHSKEKAITYYYFNSDC